MCKVHLSEISLTNSGVFFYGVLLTSWGNRIKVIAASNMFCKVLANNYVWLCCLQGFTLWPFLVHCHVDCAR